MILTFSSIAYSETKRPDPNLNKARNLSTVIAPGCTEFVHPCSGQAAAASLNAVTTPSSKTVIKPPAAAAASGASTK
ncbi:MAG: hypothetical protein J0M15_04320 [Deltaproteobacteria bacterium]|jgi:hypothetical protein|nr:hypothetical protein [Deltaproteobacteria bacterium]